MFSATMIVASLGGLLLFPQGFLKSVAYGAIATVTLAALIVHHDSSRDSRHPRQARSTRSAFKKLRKTKTNEEIENGFWGKLTRWVMQQSAQGRRPDRRGSAADDHSARRASSSAASTRRTCRRTTPPASRRRSSTNSSPAIAPSPFDSSSRARTAPTLGQISKTRKRCAGSGREVHPGGATKDGVNVLKAGLTDRNEARPDHRLPALRRRARRRDGARRRYSGHRAGLRSTHCSTVCR